MADLKNDKFCPLELSKEDLEKVTGGSFLFNESVEEARTKFIHAVGEKVTVSLNEGAIKVDGIVTKRGVGHTVLGENCAHRYDCYYYCEISSMPDKNGWFLSPYGVCGFGPKTDTEIDLKYSE